MGLDRRIGGVGEGHVSVDGDALQAEGALGGRFEQVVMRSPIGPIRDTPETWEMYVDAMHEVEAVAQAKGIDLGIDAVEKQLDFVRGMAPGIKSSMLVDVERGNPLEVETFSGMVIRLGSELNVPTPVHRCIYAILKIEDTRNRARRAEKKAMLK